MNSSEKIHEIILETKNTTVSYMYLQRRSYSKDLQQWRTIASRSGSAYKGRVRLYKKFGEHGGNEDNIGTNVF